MGLDLVVRAHAVHQKYVYRTATALFNEANEARKVMVSRDEDGRAERGCAANQNGDRNY